VAAGCLQPRRGVAIDYGSLRVVSGKGKRDIIDGLGITTVMINAWDACLQAIRSTHRVAILAV
jgi:hypothetical protein